MTTVVTGEHLDKQIRKTGEDLTRRRQRAEQYTAFLREIEQPPATDAGEFQAQRQQLGGWIESARNREADLTTTVPNLQYRYAMAATHMPV